MLLAISLNQYVLSTTKQLTPAALAFITVTRDRVCRRAAVEERTKMVENKPRVSLSLNTNIIYPPIVDIVKQRI